MRRLERGERSGHFFTRFAFALRVEHAAEETRHLLGAASLSTSASAASVSTSPVLNAANG